MQYLLWHFKKCYHLCSRALKVYFKHQRCHGIVATCWYFSYLSVASKDGLSLPGDQGVGRNVWHALYTQGSNSDPVRFYWSCPHCPRVYPQNAWGPMKSLALPLHHLLLHKTSAPLSGGPNLDDILHKKWGFPGNSCPKKGYNWSQIHGQQLLCPKKCKRVSETATDDALSVSGLT